VFPARAALLACLLFVLGLAAVSPAAGRKPPAAQAATASGYTVTRAAAPARSVVRSSTGAWVATFTDGARTVALAGPARTFSEATAASQVTTSTWVRVLAAPFAGTVDYAWLDRARAVRSPDVLATAFEFVSGRPDRRDASGRLIAGDASYGPLDDDGSREEGADWSDFQGITATYGSVADPPEPDQTNSLDCSGFMRMLWGVRIGIPLSLDPDWWGGVRARLPLSLDPEVWGKRVGLPLSPDPGGRWLPRRAWQQEATGPGVVPVANAGKQVSDFTRLQPGDLVFFDASDDDGDDIDHVGLYLGRDAAGHKRFISSRKWANGPTMGDYHGASLLDGTGLYARSFRSTRRL
jgi:NlpC/P60 family